MTNLQSRVSLLKKWGRLIILHSLRVHLDFLLRFCNEVVISSKLYKVKSEKKRFILYFVEYIILVMF